MSVETFHRSGQHVQSAHGRRRALATDGSHLQGGMIALMPTAADAKRLAVGGGEKAAELHLTLMFLGDDMSTWDDHAKDELVSNLTSLSRELDGPVTAKIFGVSRWNGKGDSPAWVWNVGHGNDGDSHALQTAHTLAIMALEHAHDHPDIPAQYEPWQPHICAAYTKESGLLKTLEQRLGEVTFDRLRVSFGDEDHDIPLESGLTAAAVLRREPTPVEVQCGADFGSIAEDWERARDTTAAALEPVLAGWRSSLRAQIMAHTAQDDPEALPELRVDTLKAEDLLRRAMLLHARRAGEACQREAESQGVTVPEWHLPEDEDTVTAAVAGRRLISSIAKATSDLMASTIVQSAKRKFSTLFHTAGSPEEIADQVDEVLAEDPGVQAAVGTAMSTAQNVGRQAVLEAAPPAQYYASEILDRNTCAPCKEVDGEEFETLAQAIKAYPVMGYGACVGPKYGNACRGLIVARWTAEPPPLTQETDDATEPGGEGAEVASAYHADETGLTAGEEAKPVSTTTEELGGKPNPGTDKDKRLEENDPNKPKSKSKGKMTLGEALEAELAAKAAAAPEADGTMTTASWKGPLCVEGKVTGDGREFCPGALTWSDLPIPLRWNRVDSHGGEARTEAVNVGRIDKIYRDGDLIMGEGVLDLSDEDGRRVHGKIKNKMLRGVSIDADSISDADVEYVMPEDMPSDMDAIDMLFMQPEKVIFNAGRIRAATLCDIPAFAEAYIEMADDEGTVVASAADGAVQAVSPVFARGIDGLIAHGGPEWKPPAAWFADPKLSLPTGITVTDEGRIYGHAAMWGTCHIGHTDVCIQPPHEEIHPYYMTGEVTTAEGTPVSVGQITVGTGHASLSVGAQAAAEHYDHTGHAVADVAVGNDAHGIWVAGSIRPGADPKLIHELRAAGQVSGDWRRIGGKLRLVGLLAVNIPGFPVPKTSARVASGAQVALVAAGRPTVYHGQTDQDSETVPDLREQMARLYDEVHGKE